MGERSLHGFDSEERAAVQRAIGENLRRERERLGLSQEVLEVRAFLGRGRVSSIECLHAKPTIFMLLALADGLGLSPAGLLEGVPALRREKSLTAVLRAVSCQPGISLEDLANAFDATWVEMHLLIRRLCLDGRLEQRGSGYWPLHAGPGNRSRVP
jgi:transcriptional regulator with XRE-family HTH domain